MYLAIASCYCTLFRNTSKRNISSRDAQRLCDMVCGSFADLKQCTVTCMVFGDAATALSQLTPGTLVAILSPQHDGKGEGSLKIISPSMVAAIGQASDFGYCQGTTRDGKACSMIVNLAICRMCDWHLKQISTKVRSLCHCRAETPQQMMNNETGTIDVAFVLPKGLTNVRIGDILC